MANKRNVSAKEKFFETEIKRLRQVNNLIEENLRSMKEENKELKRENKELLNELKILKEKYIKSLEISNMKDEDISKFIKNNDKIEKMFHLLKTTSSFLT